MSEVKSVQIPVALFDKILVFFECLSLADHTLPNIYNFNEILSELRIKQNSINLRNTYSNIIYANSEEQRRSARADYMKLRRRSY